MSFRRLVAPVVVLAFSGAALAQSVPTPPAAPAAAASAPAPAAESPAAKLVALEAMPYKPGDATAGQGKAAACGACHGMDGNSSDAQYPKLAGQQEDYIVLQLQSFMSGTRANAIMSGMAGPLSVQDMHDIGAYFASKKSLPGVADAALATTGGALYREGDAARNIPACMACHGPDGRGNPGAGYPQLAGQHADYVQKTLKAWHDGTSWGNDPHAQIMQTIAARLTDADIAAVSSYVEGLHTATPEEVAQAGTPKAAAAKPAAASSATKPASATTAPAPAASAGTH